MKCPECGAWTHVLETRRGVLRRRECANGHRFSTEEKLIEQRAQVEDRHAVATYQRRATT